MCINLLVPNCEIVLLPSEPHLQIMVLRNQFQDCIISYNKFPEVSLALTVCFDHFTLSLSNIINPSCMHLMPSTEKAFPSGDRVCADDGAMFNMVNSSILKIANR